MFVVLIAFINVNLKILNDVRKKVKDNADSKKISLYPEKENNLII